MLKTASSRIALAIAAIAFTLCLAPGWAWATEGDAGAFEPLGRQTNALVAGTQADVTTMSVAADAASIDGQALALSNTSLPYNGAVQKPKALSIGGYSLKEGVDYTLRYSPDSPKAVGTYTVQAIGVGTYTGISAKASFKIVKAANPMRAAAKSSRNTIRYALVQKANQTIKKSKAFSVSKAKGNVTFRKKSGNSKITVSKKGLITVKKGLGAGTYKVKVLVKAAGNANYKAASKVVTLKIRLRGDIKGNISYTTGEKIYHVPGDRYYNDTIIDESEGERWFVTEKQARNAGWRHSYV